MLQTGYCWVNLMIYREIWVISWKGPIWLLLLILLRDRKMLYYIFAYMSILLLRSCDLNLHITSCELWCSMSILLLRSCDLNLHITSCDLNLHISCELWCSLDCKFHGSILLFEKPDLVLMIFFLKRNKWFILLLRRCRAVVPIFYLYYWYPRSHSV